MSFDLYMLGAEQVAWRTLLRDLGVSNVGLSYWSARKRLPKKKPWDMSEWGFDKIFLDSGGFTANREPEKYTLREWRGYADEYVDFVLEHEPDCAMVSEFDCLALGPAWIEKMRQEVWDRLPAEKFLPIWHPEHGLEALEELGGRYARIGIAQDHIAQPGVNITPHLNKLASRGVQLHGLAMSRPDAIRHVRFASASSTSWLSPMRYGETIIWDGARLCRYPTKMKEQARLRHRSDFTRAGFDVDLINADDPQEITRVSVWSWLQYEASVAGDRVTRQRRPEVAQDAEEAPDGVGGDVEPVRNSRSTPEPPTVRVRATDAVLPVLGFTEVEATTKDADEPTRIRLPVVSSAPMRTCNTCFVRAECPRFEEDSTCVFEIPIEIRTPQQRRAMMEGLMELQAQRVAFMRFREELSGGYADPNLSQEIDRFMKIFSTVAEIEDDRDFFKMSVEGRGKAGVLSRLFGRDAGEQAAQANYTGPKMGPADTDRVIAKVIQGSVE